MIPIEADGKLIIEQLNKKSISIKERLVVIFKKVDEFNRNAQKGVIGVFPSDELSDTLLSLNDYSNLKICQSTISILQKLISLQLFSKNYVPKLISVLFTLKGAEDLSLKIKLIQLLIPLSDSRLLDYGNLTLVQNIYLIGFTEYMSKNKQIQTTSMAALFQISFMIFDNSLPKLNPSENDTIIEKPSIYVHVINQILSDFLGMLDGQLPKWLTSAGIKLDNVTNLGLDLILALLKQCGQKIFSNGQLSFLLEQKFLSFLKIHLGTQQPITDFSWLIRLVRSIYFLLIFSEKSMELVHFLNTSLVFKANTIQIFLSLEIFILLISNGNFLFKFYHHFKDKTNNYFGEFLVALVKNTEMLEKISDQDLLKNDVIPKLRMSKLIEPNFTEVDIPNISYGNINKLTIELLGAITNSLNNLSSQFGVDLNLIQQIELNENSIKYQSLVSQIWKSLHQCLANLLRPNLPEVMHLELISHIQLLVQITGTLKIPQGRDEFIHLLLKSSIPSGGKLINKNIQSVNRVMNIIHGMHALLEKKSWILILQTMQQIEILNSTTTSSLQKGLGNSYNSSQPKKEIEVGREDQDTLTSLGILANNEGNFFLKVTKDFSKSSLLSIIEALVDLANKNTKDQGIDLKKFALEKISHIVTLNASQLPVYWEVVVSCLYNILLSPNTTIKDLALKYLVKMTITAFKVNTSEINNSTDWQQYLLKPLKNLKIEGDIELSNNIIDLCLQILQVGSLSISAEALQLLLHFIKRCLNEKIASIKVIEVVRGIINDYGEIIFLMDFIELNFIITGITTYTNDNNIYYQATGLMWKVADYVNGRQRKETGKENDSVYSEIWKNIFENLQKYAMEIHSETRNAAITIFSSILISYGDNLSLDLWLFAFLSLYLALVDDIVDVYLSLKKESSIQNKEINDVINKILEKTKTPSSKLSHSLKSDLESKAKQTSGKEMLEKQFEESLIILVQNYTKLTQKFLLILVEKNEINNFDNAYPVLFEKVKLLQTVSKCEIYLEVVKSLHEISITSSKSEKFIIKASEMNDIMTEIQKKLNTPPKDSKVFKFMMNRILPEILCFLSDYLLQSKNEIDEKVFSFILTILNKILAYQSKDEEFLKTKVAVDEKDIYDKFSHYIHVVSKLNPTLQITFCLYLIDEISVPIDSKMKEFNITNLIKIIKTESKKIVEMINLDMKCCQNFLFSVSNIIGLRSKKDYIALQTNALKNSIPVWVSASSLLQELIIQLLSCLNNPEIVDIIIKTYETIIDTTSSKKIIFHSLNSKMKKQYVEVDKELINVLFENILTNTFKNNANETLLVKLVDVIDKCFTSYSTFEISLSHESNSKDIIEIATNICSSCMEFLFKIANTQECESSSIGKIALKALILRCKNIVGKYMREEKSSSSPLPRNRVVEVLNILQNLMVMMIPENSIEITNDQSQVDNGTSALLKVCLPDMSNSYLYQGPRGHLFYLYPCFTDMITVNDPSIKEKIKLILCEIYKEIGGVLQK